MFDLDPVLLQPVHELDRQDRALVLPFVEGLVGTFSFILGILSGGGRTSTSSGSPPSSLVILLILSFFDGDCLTDHTDQVRITQNQAATQHQI